MIQFVVITIPYRLIASFGPIRGAQPAGTYWADNFPHTAWFDMSEYYIKAFKTGSYPAIKVRLVSSGADYTDHDSARSPGRYYLLLVKTPSCSSDCFQ